MNQSLLFSMQRYNAWPRMTRATHYFLEEHDVKNPSAGPDLFQPSNISLISDIIGGPPAHVLNLCLGQSTFSNE